MVQKTFDSGSVIKGQCAQIWKKAHHQECDMQHYLHVTSFPFSHYLELQITYKPLTRGISWLIHSTHV